MLNRRELLLALGFTAGAVWPAPAAAIQRRKKAPKLTTVTLEISGMT
jgi:hypothetical protein